MASVMCLQFNVQEDVIIEDTNAKCHLCILLVSFYTMTLLNKLMPRY